MGIFMSVSAFIFVVAVIALVVAIIMRPDIWNGLRLRAKAGANRLSKTVNNPAALVEVRIEEAREKVDEFKNKILDLRKAVKLDEGREPGLANDVKKWENIYIKAKEAGDAVDAEKAAQHLERADKRLKACREAITENRKLLDTLENQRRDAEDTISDADVAKERLEAKQKSAELRASAISHGATLGELNALTDFEKLVDDSEAYADAVEEQRGLDTNLEKKYTGVNEAHNERLAKLLAERKENV